MDGKKSHNQLINGWKKHVTLLNGQKLITCVIGGICKQKEEGGGYAC
jgi:hypothetical protein